MFHDLVTSKPPPAIRIAKTEGDFERHFTEAAVMLAFAFHLLENDSNLQEVELLQMVSMASNLIFVHGLKVAATISLGRKVQLLMGAYILMAKYLKALHHIQGQKEKVLKNARNGAIAKFGPICLGETT
ncbi:MAG: hypothetical protein K8S13_18360 [Desulfobacula sp.]|uniref:hypothetical protein n=1 Tax=Desulfobacula sp. TaxID=2593537 RepID=UPI0025C24B0A|nr:hypothetical protein [Desulfobacula sp.]MCD4721800.1 hypothetical protein [Desulfobacula sp.]